jgi:putative ABC transport system permease protein
VACLLALVIGMAGVSTASPWLLANYGLQIALRPLTSEEWALLVSVPVAAFIVALIPAFNTWRQSRRLGFGEAADQ